MAQQTSYDLVIVGGGMAGCILAARIAENGVHPQTRDRLRIALVEAGPYLKGAPRPGYGVPSRRQLFTNVSHEFSENNRYSMPGGAMILGGSSMHYGAQAFPPFPADYGNWVSATGVDWTVGNLKEAADEVRQVFNVHSDPEEILSEGQKGFRNAARSLGYQVRPLEGAKKNCIRCGFCNAANMCKYDAKMSALLTHVPAAEEHGVEIIPDTMVEKVLFDGKKATGVMGRQGDRETLIEGDKIMLSGGTVQTPLLLWKSGFGPADMLGSNTLINNPNVGQHAHAHFGLFLRSLFPEPIKEGDRGWNAGTFIITDIKPNSHDRLLIQDSGMGGQESPNQTALSEFAPEFGREHKTFMKEGARRLGRTSIWIVPGELEGHLNEAGNILYPEANPIELGRVREGVERATQIMQKMGATRVTPAERAMRGLFHPHVLGTCRAGTDPRTSVTDAHFRAHDADNLFICDGSVVPRTGTGNSGMVVATVATFAAQRMVQDHFS